mmetsp:Transcript_29846/g.96638  ORF Transcript_29846/g.96638 Transcript_29846/m.96638 type:complete len:114 (+) Transcript_29846:1254-1595(+)
MTRKRPSDSVSAVYQIAPTHIGNHRCNLGRRYNLGQPFTIGWLAVNLIRPAQSWAAQTVHSQYNFATGPRLSGGSLVWRKILLNNSLFDVVLCVATACFIVVSFIELSGIRGD